jgi:hypothetical protein
VAPQGLPDGYSGRWRMGSVDLLRIKRGIRSGPLILI